MSEEILAGAMMVLGLGLALCAVFVLALFMISAILVGFPTINQNMEFKENFCEQNGGNEFKEGACIKFHNGTFTETRINCEGTPQPAFIVFDGVWEKITKCYLEEAERK